MSTRSYDVRITALTLDVSPKWLDNLLSHHEVPGCSRGRQGVERRITAEGMLTVAVVRVLNEELGIPLGRAAALVRQADEGRARVRLSAGIEMRVPVAEIERDLQERLRDAVQAAPRVRRGRPPKQHR